MTTIPDNASGARLDRGDRWFAASAIAAIAAVGLLAASSPAVGMAVALASLLGIAVLIWPDLAVVAACFLVYSNAAVVGVKFHGVPAAVGGAVPALLLIPIAYHIVLRHRRFVIPPEMPWVACYFAVAAVGAACSRDPSQAAVSLQEMLIEGLGLYLLFTNAIRSPGTMRRTTWALLAAGVLMGLVPLYQQATGAFQTNFGGFGQTSELPFRGDRHDPTSSQFRLAGPIGEINRYAQFMLMLLPVGLIRAFQERGPWRRGLALGACGIIGAAFALAFSRGAAVAAVLLFFVMLVLRVVSIRQALLVALGGCLLLVAMPKYLTRLSSLPGLSTVFSQPERAPDGAVRGRLTEMIAAAQVYADHPVIGVGPGMFRYYSQEYGNRLNIRRLDETRESHCLYLDIAAENGTLGLIALGGAVMVTMLRLWRARRQCAIRHPELAGFATAALLMLLAYLATGLFLHLSYLRYFWLTLALATAAATMAERAGAGARSASLGKTRTL